ncbi:hypothetical protein M9H77_26940 [Catharanthus roseus]|uniref:Uncharacterized protein n=1 Tax=Catharanthus roseus TaxID=4058 RepID=A0ACC0ACI8_CATRO|nr:hypothetical protein M9H77_26940 [Catharanthus roseus]
MDAQNFQPLHGVGEKTSSSSSDWSTSSSSSLTVVYNIVGSSETICVTTTLSLSFKQSKDWDPYLGISIFSLPVRYVKAFGGSAGSERIVSPAISHPFTWHCQPIGTKVMDSNWYKRNGMK